MVHPTQNCILRWPQVDVSSVIFHDLKGRRCIFLFLKDESRSRLQMPLQYIWIWKHSTAWCTGTMHLEILIIRTCGALVEFAVTQSMSYIWWETPITALARLLHTQRCKNGSTMIQQNFILPQRKNLETKRGGSRQRNVTGNDEELKNEALAPATLQVWRWTRTPAHLLKSRLQMQLKRQNTGNSLDQKIILEALESWTAKATEWCILNCSCKQ